MGVGVWGNSVLQYVYMTPKIKEKVELIGDLRADRNLSCKSRQRLMHSSDNF